MKGWLLGLYAIGWMSPASAAGDWQFAGHAESEAAPACDVQIQGDVFESAGTDIQLVCDATHSYIGNLQLTLPARALQQRRVMLVAELRSDDSLLVNVSLKTLRDRTLMVEDDTEQTLLGSDAADGWQLRQLSLPVDVDAAQLRVGVLLQGHGKLSLRNVRLVVSQPGPSSEAAVTYLDHVLVLLKQQTADRHDLRWRVLEPQMRVLASGAQTTDEVYPAIRYALAMLGDQRNMLLTPQVVQALHVSASNEAGNTRRLALSDGAQLVLAPLPPTRTAQNASSSITKALP